MPQVSFADLRFGFASAETEGIRDPQLLLEGYYDHYGLIDQAVTGDRFLFLGYKGSGKSAIGQRLRLLSETDPSLFVASAYLAEFPYASFRKVASGDAEPESRYPTAWAWILLLRLIDSLRSDAGSESTRDPRFIRACQALERLGLLQVDNLKQLVLTSSKATFKAQVPSLLEMGFEGQFTSQDTAMVQLVGFLRRLVAEFRSPNEHILVVDGLDDILSQREVQYQSLAALVLEVARLNEEFHGSGSPAKILLLCRPDLFELLPGANKNKVRRDSAVVLDWYHDTREPGNSALADLINLRANLSGLEESEDVVERFFPPKMDGQPTLKFLLDLTRHTPRDFIQLMDSIQTFVGATPKGNDGRISREQVLGGMRHYSINYFLPEIKDELVGVGTPGEVRAIFELISGVRSRDFKFDALRKAAFQSGVPSLERLDVEKMLHGLFECSALGTVHETSGYDAYTFKYRNRNSSLGMTNRLILHKGIWKAMNLT